METFGLKYLVQNSPRTTAIVSMTFGVVSIVIPGEMSGLVEMVMYRYLVTSKNIWGGGGILPKLL